jgi:mono/diheme cytochrome c family protein
MTRIPYILFAAALMASGLGCHDDMYNQPRYEALEASDFFDDGRASRPLVPGTVQYQAEPTTGVLHTGRNDGELATELPLELTEALLKRGQERFNIYCSVCHSRIGDGNGMIVQRGYRQPPTLHSDRLRGAPIGHFFDVMTNGFGAMPAYSLQVKPEDRWAIAAYIRALQLSQHAAGDDLPEDVRSELEKAPREGEAPAEPPHDVANETANGSTGASPSRFVFQTQLTSSLP